MTGYQFMQLPDLQFHGEKQAGSVSGCDGVIVVFHDAEALATLNIPSSLDPSVKLLTEFVKSDESSKKKDVNVIINSNLPGGKMIVTPTGPLLRDHDDVRRYAEAVKRAISRAKSMETMKRPLLVLQPPPFDKMEESVRAEFALYYEVATLAALAEMHEPVEARETLPDLEQKALKGLQVVILGEDESVLATKLEFVKAIETGRRLARDIGSPDPERMSSINAAETVKTFMSTLSNVQVSVIESLETLKKEYPLFAAVTRAAEHVPRHAPRVVHLEYRSPDQSQVTEELYMVGKGINYDTGGANIKTGGNMTGMSRDKCGAAAMAGFVATCAMLKPKHINLSVDLAFARNSVGSNAYVADEIIRSRAGVRVRVGNTDAEGRMVMADLLAQMKERALASSDPSKARIFTCATLTGHCVYAYGPYVAAMENGPAKMLRLGERLKCNGQKIGDCLEVSTMRPEDYEVISPVTNCEDVLQIPMRSSGMIARGHQYPAAFLAIASGLNKHSLDVEPQKRLAYTHLDVAGAAEEKPGPYGRITATPIAALTMTFLKN
ncbi:Leucine aminopeptidase [Paramicrosporidium saccamoebae]|uniref:Leucine aminopeptidase n=1 Tax=Paramicrosporidium saccamoebae TaxID=1246581 RepID=A0A2H9THZ2_9FUNG|nr:Leucine aminopeptidase [Paramicrosporidium saccamoebae]